MTNDWYLQPAATLDKTALTAAQEHQAKLTKPSGSLGELETIALQFSAWQGTKTPRCEKVLIRVFAGDHGICKDRVDDDGVPLANVSAFPQSVTAQMVLNFINGGAAINVLARQLEADFTVVNMGTVEPITSTSPHYVSHQLMNGTHDFTQQAAMSAETCVNAMDAGRGQVIDKHADVFIGGEMGIGNTTCAAIIYSLLLKVGPEVTVGPGTGVDKDGLAIKRKMIYQAFNRHGDALKTPLSILQHVGGLEIAALVGAYIAAAQQGMPILVDGFITTAAAMLAVQINPSVRDWMMFAHQSAEPAHIKALDKLNARALINLNMRLGEGSGAAVVVPLIQSALALHSQMATFDQANVSGNSNTTEPNTP